LFYHLSIPIDISQLGIDRWKQVCEQSKEETSIARAGSNK